MIMADEKARILVVDDDPECLEFATVVLGKTYDVKTASSLPGCREALGREKPDLMILDVMMQDLCDGLDMTRELKASVQTADIPVIMLTAVNDSYDYRSQMSPDFFPHDRWLDKPVKPEVLQEAVATLLNK